jgi:hypothetical protein
VSAFEPQPPAEPRVDMPEFMVVLRGFDRRQVEAWAKELAHQVEQERQRANEAERALYRRQMEGSSPPSYSHLGAHVASIIEEAGKSAEAMQADAAERAQETVEQAEAEGVGLIKAAEHRAGEIEQEARRVLDASRAEGERVATEARDAAEEMRAQAEQDARAVLEEARDATDLIWREAQRERVTVEGETRRLEALRSRAYEQLSRMYGHLESVLDEVRRGIGVQPEIDLTDEGLATVEPAEPVGPVPGEPEPAEPVESAEPDQPEPAEPAEPIQAEAVGTGAGTTTERTPAAQDEDPEATQPTPAAADPDATQRLQPVRPSGRGARSAAAANAKPRT